MVQFKVSFGDVKYEPEIDSFIVRFFTLVAFLVFIRKDSMHRDAQSCSKYSATYSRWRIFFIFY